ncbi:hypothetical protein ACHAXA_006147 [Cyclostephanos tholiformis]|uniref:PIN domain-containing protein n=1 Tax=Cyclostephanos tholiformis TaxID=382380 RepID=A0ABD3RY78_9STRA
MMDQNTWLICAPPQHQREGDGGGGGGGLNDDDRTISVLPDAIHSHLKPSYVVIDSNFLDRHRDRASGLLDELRRLRSNEGNNDGKEGDADDGELMTTVVEVMDDGLLVPFDRVPKVLDRSRRGGRTLRWSTFLGNALAVNEKKRSGGSRTTHPRHTLPSSAPSRDARIGIEFHLGDAAHRILFPAVGTAFAFGLGRDIGRRCNATCRRHRRRMYRKRHRRNAARIRINSVITHIREGCRGVMSKSPPT